MTARLWIDVEDLFQYAVYNPRPSGIQRLEFELCRALTSEMSDRVCFVRHDQARQTFFTVSWKQVDALFSSMINESKPARTAANADIGMPDSATHNALKRAVYRMPMTVRIPLIELARDLGSAATSCIKLARALAALVSRRIQGRRGRLISTRPDPSAPDFTTSARPGDFIGALGAPWFDPNYGQKIEKACKEKGLSFALLLYDLIPLRRPEYCHPGLVKSFGECMRSILPQADVILAISKYTAEDVQRYAKETGVRLRTSPAVIPIGTKFQQRDIKPEHDNGLPLPETYALFVSTIEARKNHVLLFRLWRRLLEEMPRDKVPTLVFAGRIGWMVTDFMQQLRNTRFLDGKIVVIDNPTDTQIEALYKGCLFTLFPSFYEGWGLPVTESLFFGRPCIASNAASLPEAGGPLARYFDPDNLSEAYRLVCGAINDREALAAWRERVEREFRPTTWEVTARAVFHALMTLAPSRPDAVAASG